MGTLDRVLPPPLAPETFVSCLDGVLFKFTCPPLALAVVEMFDALLLADPVVVVEDPLLLSGVFGEDTAEVFALEAIEEIVAVELEFD